MMLHENKTLSNTSVNDVYNTNKNIICATFFTISTVSILFNGLVVSLFCWKARLLLQKKPSNSILFSLSVCDVLTGVDLILTTVTILVGNIPLSYRILLDICEAFLAKTLLFHLCGLTLDRYIALFFALRYETIVTHTNIRRFIIISWTIPFLASVVQLTWLYEVMAGTISSYVAEIDFWFSLIAFLLFLAVPMILLAIAFITMLIEIQRIIRSTPEIEGLSTVTVKEKRAIHMFSLMYLTFLLLGMPYYTYRLWNDIRHYLHGVQDNVSPAVWRLIVALKYFTSIIRPLLYGFSSFELRKVGRQLMDKLLRCNNFMYIDSSKQFQLSQLLGRSPRTGKHNGEIDFKYDYNLKVTRSETDTTVC